MERLTFHLLSYVQLPKPHEKHKHYKQMYLVDKGYITTTMPVTPRKTVYISKCLLAGHCGESLGEQHGMETHAVAAARAFKAGRHLV